MFVKVSFCISSHILKNRATTQQNISFLTRFKFNVCTHKVTVKPSFSRGSNFRVFRGKQKLEPADIKIGRNNSGKAIFIFTDSFSILSGKN